MSSIQFTVNGQECVVDQSTSRATTLNAYLRYTLGLPGTKAMCHEGGCGACVVAVRARRPTSGRVELFSVNSCLVLVFSCHEWEIITIEGLGNRRNGYNDIQKRISAFNATQCGYCTPGWAMHLYSLRDKNLTMAEMEKAFASNTCRCTGFRPIMDTVKSFAVDASPELCQRVADIEDLKICAKTNLPCEKKCSTHSEDSGCTFIPEYIKEVEANQRTEATIALSAVTQMFFKVYDEQEIFRILRDNDIESYMLIDGNTGKGVYEDFEYPPNLIDISSVKTLKEYSYDQNLILGANITLEDCIGICKNAANIRNEFAYLSGFVKHLELVAHMPVRKIGSLAGNLMLKHAMPMFPSDVFLLLETVGATITIRNRYQMNTLTLPNFLKHDMKGWLIVKIELPPLNSSHIFTSYKIMPRHQNALAIVNAGFLIEKDPNSNLICDVRIVFGNISPDFVHATRTENYLKGRNLFINETLQGAIDVLNQEVNPVDSPPQPSNECRKKLAIGLFYKFILSISPPNLTTARNRSGGSFIPRPISKGTQDFQTDETLFPLNQPVPKLEAMIQSAGEAEYANDVPPFPKEVFGAFVLSTVHNGQVDTIDIQKILKTKGVLAVYTPQDIPGKNSFTRPGFQLETEDEEILATDIKFYGQPIAIVVANTQELAARAAKRVEVTYKNVSSAPPVLTIDQAKLDSKRYTAYADVGIEPKSRGDNVTKVLKGVYEIESQCHYYMEPITCVVVPIDDKLELYNSTQWLDLAQIAIAQCLDEKESKIFVKCRRVGGAFGGKISRNAQAATACAIIARKMNLPARFILPMQTNLTTAGRRLSCQCDYEVGVDDDGKIQYLDATVIEDDGCSHNENILAYTISGFPNCYDKDNFSVKAAAVLTDLPSNSYNRAPGNAEGMACIENIMEHIAFAIQKDSTEVRKINMRKDDNDLPILIEEFKTDTDYDERVKEVEQFNMVNRWMKKAIQISVMNFPVFFYGNYSSMVSIYRGDGTVTVTTGGIEMGQGVNTKVAQVCAYELGIPLENVSILPHFSFSSANNIFSGSSITSESVCYATIQACKMLKARLAPIKEKMTNPTWEELVMKAGDEMVDLTAMYMMTDQEADLSKYIAYAVTILEVQLDVLTGRFELLRVDILEDVGLSVNPNLDVGQVEGGYIHGVGYFTSEKLVFDQTTGKLLTNRSLTYHVPLALDIPAIFNIKLRYNSKNPKGVLGAKAVGEMGVCTAHGVTHALRRCIQESRRDSGYDTTEWINISVPYDTESILKALDVKLEEMLLTES